MHFERIELQDFRLYGRLTVEFDPGVNVLVGPNAAGKTTVLEALSLLATARSFRGAADADIVRAGQDGYRVSGRFSGHLGSHTTDVRYLAAGDGTPSRPFRKTVSVDDRSLSRPGELLGRVPLVSFSPDDLSLVKGGPAERRRFLDLFLAQTSPAHRDTLARYHRTLAQRNALLADLAARRVSTGAVGELLEPWDESLAAEARSLQEARAGAADALSSPSATAFREVDGGQLEVEYQADEFDRGRRADELRRGVTLSGPHRDELHLVAGGHDARRFASQGQQRSIVLSLKLATLQLLEEQVSESPVLLLDDVMSELDPRRRASLLPLLWRGQAFVTATDRVGLERTLTDRKLSDMVGTWFTVGGASVMRSEAPRREGASP